MRVIKEKAIQCGNLVRTFVRSTLVIVVSAPVTLVGSCLTLTLRFEIGICTSEWLVDWGFTMIFVLFADGPALARLSLDMVKIATRSTRCLAVKKHPAWVVVAFSVRRPVCAVLIGVATTFTEWHPSSSADLNSKNAKRRAQCNRKDFLHLLNNYSLVTLKIQS